MTTPWVMGKPREELERSIRKTDGAVPVFTFFSSEKKVPSGQCHLSPEPEGFSSRVLLESTVGAPTVAQGRKERVSPLPQLCLEGEPTPPPVLSLLPDENQMSSAPGTCGALCS